MWERYSSFDWSRDSSMDKVCLFQSMVGLTSISQGSPRITFSFPREMTWKVTFRAIPSMLRKRVEVKRITPLLLIELLAFLA